MSSGSSKRRNEAAPGTAQRSTTSNPKSRAFADISLMKTKIRTAFLEGEYSEKTLYSKTGIIQCVARHAAFANAVNAVTLLYAVWLAVDVDYNSSEGSLFDAAPMFIALDIFFYLFYFAEWIIRLGAMHRKLLGFTDPWFAIDTLLLLAMKLELWLTPLPLMLGGELVQSATVLLLVRGARVARIGRIFRIMRAVPELMILVRGLFVAMRSVLSTMLLLCLVLYAYSIFFVQQTKGHDIGGHYFHNTPNAFMTLFIWTTAPETWPFFQDLWAVSPICICGLLTLIVFASLVVMNMFVGMFVDIVFVMAAAERDAVTIRDVKEKLECMLTRLGIDVSRQPMIHTDVFYGLLQKPEAARTISSLGVDVDALADQCDLTLAGSNGDLNFDDVLDLILQSRGRQAATVKDIVELRRSILTELRKDTRRLGKQLGEPTLDPIGTVGELQTFPEPVKMAVHGPNDESTFAEEAAFPASLSSTLPPESQLIIKNVKSLFDAAVKDIITLIVEGQLDIARRIDIMQATQTVVRGADAGGYPTAQPPQPEKGSATPIQFEAITLKDILVAVMEGQMDLAQRIDTMKPSNGGKGVNVRPQPQPEPKLVAPETMALRSWARREDRGVGGELDYESERMYPSTRTAQTDVDVKDFSDLDSGIKDFSRRGVADLNHVQVGRV